MNSREDLLYHEIINKIEDTPQSYPLYKNSKFLLGCLFLVAGIVFGYLQAGINNRNNQTNDVYTVFYSPFYRNIVDLEVDHGNKQKLEQKNNSNT